MDYSELCEKVLAIDPAIRYASVLTRDGRKVAGGMRAEVKSMEPREVGEEMDFQTAHYHSAFERWERYFGTLNFTHVRYQNLLVFFFPLGAYILNVTTQPNLEFDKVREITSLASTARQTPPI